MDRAKDLHEVTDRVGMSLLELCAMINEETFDLSVFKMNDEDHKEYHRLFTLFDQSRAGRSGNKGRALEDLASFLLSKLGVYQVWRNKRTSTNEMDVVLVKSPLLSAVGGELLPPHIICECKNYGTSVSVTYVGKFYSLLKVSGVRLGLMISDAKISGRNKWDSGKGLCRKIALRDKTLILNISYEDLKAIDQRKASLIQLMNDKMREIKLDIEITHDKHPLCGDSDFTAVSGN